METAIVKTSFAALDLRAETLASLEAKGYKAPTDVQAEAIPRALAGKDLVVQSRTGTGKTAAFGLPIAEKVDPERAEVQAVVLTPTRELALQVADEVSGLGRGRGDQGRDDLRGRLHGPPARGPAGGGPGGGGHPGARPRSPAPAHPALRPR